MPQQLVKQVYPYQIPVGPVWFQSNPKSPFISEHAVPNMTHFHSHCQPQMQFRMPIPNRPMMQSSNFHPIQQQLKRKDEKHLNRIYVDDTNNINNMEKNTNKIANNNELNPMINNNNNSDGANLLLVDDQNSKYNNEKSKNQTPITIDDTNSNSINVSCFNQIYSNNDQNTNSIDEHNLDQNNNLEFNVS